MLTDKTSAKQLLLRSSSSLRGCATVKKNMITSLYKKTKQQSLFHLISFASDTQLDESVNTEITSPFE